MTIGQQIIYASSFVGLLALFGSYIGWQSTSNLQQQLQTCSIESTQKANSLRLAQENLLGVHRKLLYGSDSEQVLKAFTENAESIKKTDLISGEALMELIQDYKQLNNPGIPVALEKVRPLTYKGAELIATAHANNENQIAIQSESIRQKLSTLSKWIIGICLAMCLIAVALGRVIAAGLSKSLSKLEEAALKMRQGDLSHRVDLKSRNEFGKLGRTFNALAEEAEQAEIIEKQKTELESLNAQLKLKNDSLDSFVYRVSHDLKAPLVNIVSLQKIIKEKINLRSDEILGKSFGFLEKNSEKLQQTIHDLLKVTRIERNLNNDKDWISIQETLDIVMDENIEDIEKSDTQIEVQLSEASELFFNPANFKSILANLITNAIKYRKDEGQNIINISSRQTEQHIELIVEDNGIGLNIEKHQNKLFGIFNRFHNHVEGSGVGLYIVKKLMEENGGSIELESEVGKGTKFILSFLVEEEVGVLA